MADAPRRRSAQRLTGPLVYGSLAALWEIGVRQFGIPAWLLPVPSAIAGTALHWAPELASHTLVTLRETTFGFLLALIVSVPLAVVITFAPIARQVLYPILLGLQSIPKVALAPLVVLWLGVGEWPKIVIVVLVCFFPILVNVVAGLEATPQAMLDLMKSLTASRLQTFRRLHLLVALPHLFTGCKVAITFAVIGSVIGEFVAAQDGLGYLILTSTAQSQTPLAFAALIILTTISVVLFSAIEWIERRVVTWSP